MKKIKSLLAYKILREFKTTLVAIFRAIFGLAKRMTTIIKDHYYEKRLGIETTELCFLKDDTSLYKDSQAYQPTPYAVLEKVVNYLKLGPDDIFVDLGCGQGRVICFVGLQKIKKVIGVEIRRELVDIANQNVKNLKLNNAPIEIVNTDVTSFNYKDGTVFFMFNPFGEKTLARIIDNIRQSLASNPRKIWIVYYSAPYRGILDSQDWLVQQDQINNQHILTWRNKNYGNA